MHAKTGVFKVTLLLALCRLIIAGPMHNATRPANNSEEFSGNGTTEEEETNNNEEETTFQRARPIRQVHFNEYLLEAYKVADLAKRTNCTEDLQILNQTVSEHFCTSNKTVYSLLNATPSQRETPFQNYTYRLCSNVTLAGPQDEILGHDFLLYLRAPVEEVKLKVLLVWTVNATPPWEELVANRSIPVHGSGWQVFHLKSETDESIAKRKECVDMYVQVTTVSNRITLLTRSQMQEKFVLDEFSPSEIARQPFVATFMLHYGAITLPPIFGKRSADLTWCSQSLKCSLQSHRVDLNDYLPVKILHPRQVDLGRCGNTHHPYPHVVTIREEREEEKNLARELGSGDLSWPSVYQCVPEKYSSLLVLMSVAGELVLELIPDFVITGCALQPCRDF